MNILVTGSKGQLGNELRRIAEESRFSGWMFVFVDVDDLDICDKEAVDGCLMEYAVDAVINCAAYTAVDKAEVDRDAAFRVNRDGVKILSEACAARGAFLLHISTDYVFDGTSRSPYTEEDAVNPIGVYGLSKRAGEEAMLQSGVNGVIVRTAWLYSAFGHNFVKTMLKLGAEKEEVRVVADQHGSPTWAFDLAQAVMEIILKGDIANRRGVRFYHFTDGGECTWYEFACAIMETGGRKCKVSPIGSDEYPSPCKRPEYSVLSKDRIKAEFGVEVPHWRDSLVRMLEDLGRV